MVNISIHFELSPKALNTGRHKILLRLSNGRSKRKRVSTEFQVQKNDFNPKAKYGKWVRMSDSRHEVINRKLMDLYKKAETKINELELLEPISAIDTVCDFLQGKEVQCPEPVQITFIEFFKIITDRMYAAKQANTLRKYLVTYRKICKHFDGRPFHFEDFNISFIYEYESSLKTQGLAVNTISKEFAVLKAVLFKAIKEGYFQLDKNPFFQYKLKFTKSTKEKLDIDEIRRIELLKFSKDTLLSDVRNVWLFSLYNGGIRMGDLCRLRWSNIIDDRLVYRMNKTSTQKTFRLLPQAQEILNLYKSDNNEDYIFPLLKNDRSYDEFTVLNAISSQNAVYNKYLKEIARLTNINKKLSMHVSRHSFADIARKKGIGIYTISKALGHSSLKETETYLQSLDEASVDESIIGIFS